MHSSKTVQLLLHQSRKLLHLPLHPLQLLPRLTRPLHELLPLLLNFPHGCLHSFPCKFQLSIFSLKITTLFLNKPPSPLDLILIHRLRIPAFDRLYFIGFEFLGFQNNLVQQLLLRFNHILVISYQTLHIRYTRHLLVCLLVIHCLTRPHRLLEFVNVLCQNLNRLRTERTGNVQQLWLERG